MRIEDTAEIQIQKENILRFEARREQDCLPAVTIRDALKATLRHRPDRIILGEIRSGEAFDILQLLNTGHSGAISTVHANYAGEGISRFTTCILQSGVEIPYRAIRANIAESLNVIVQMDRRPGPRFVSEVSEMRGYKAEVDRYCLESICFVVAHKGYESYSGRSALGVPQGYAPGQANDKENSKNQKQKGDISNEVRKGTFLKSFDTQGDLRLTREDGCCTVWPKDKVEIGSSGGDTAGRKDPL